MTLKSNVLLRCSYEDGTEKDITITVESLNEVDETSNIIEAISELRSTEHYTRVKYMKKEAA